MSTEGTEKDKNVLPEEINAVKSAQEPASEKMEKLSEEPAAENMEKTVAESAENLEKPAEEPAENLEKPSEESAAVNEKAHPKTPEEEEAQKKKRRKIMMIAAGAAAVILIAFFAYSGWFKLPWMTNRYFLQHGMTAKQQWIRDGEEYYYMDEKGHMVTGQKDVDGFYYYFDKETGVMQTGWVTDEETQQKMYFQPGSGKAPVGWAQIEDNFYYFSEQGVMQTGWVTVDGQKYYMDENGCRCTGWQTVDGEEYYLDEEGAMQTGWVEAGGETYLMDSEGRKQTGKQTVDGKEYYFDNDGAMRTGWSQKDGKRYYYGKDGSLQTGLITVEGEKFYLGEDGSVDPGWHESDEGSFYVCSDGFVADPKDGTGNYGRLIVRNVGIDVFLYTGNSRDDYQTIVDEENSAIVVQERRDLEPVIADRRSQGFNLSGIVEGNTACVVYADGTVQEFVCSRTTTATNQGTDIVDKLNISIWKQNEGGLAAYASAGTGNAEEVITVFWEPIKEEENSADGTENGEGGDSASEDGGNETGEESSEE